MAFGKNILMSGRDDSASSDASAKSGKTKTFLFIFAGVAVSGVLLYLAGLLFGFSPMWYQGFAPKQPIPFSHRIHAGQYNMPCLYCHSSAEYAAHSEVPGLDVCMNCHQSVKTDSPLIQQIQEAYKSNKPIKWVKVHVLPDFVRFNHSRHVQAGVACQNCHGEVQTMDKVSQFAGLNMGWCVNCHRSDNFLQEHRTQLKAAEKELKGEPEMPEELKKIHRMVGHPEVQNADVSCSTCHY